MKWSLVGPKREKTMLDERSNIFIKLTFCEILMLKLFTFEINVELLFIYLVAIET